MKKWIKILSMVLCLILSQVPVLEPVTTLQTVQAATTKTVKNGLKKENGQYYYYVKGKKVKNTWKTVTVTNSKTHKKPVTAIISQVQAGLIKAEHLGEKAILL